MKPGDRIGNYVIERPIAGGGMGMVYQGVNPRLGRKVAIKVLLPSYAQSSKVRHRFEQEAYVQAQLEHGSIVRVIDMVVEGDELALIMEYIDGPSLESVLTDTHPGPWPLSQALQVFVPVVDALAYAHARGIVHRDVKPGNVLLAPGPGLGVPKVTDFGLAKILSDSIAMTKTGSKMGTMPYMAPEQFEGKKDIGTAADVFALGILFWRLLAGQLPVEPDNMKACLLLYMGSEPMPRMETLRPDLPADVQTFLDRACALSPADRFPDGQSMLDACQRLTPIAGPHPAAPAVLLPVATASPAPSTPPNPNPTWHPSSSPPAAESIGSWKLIASGVIGTLVVLLLIGTVLYDTSSKIEPAATPVPTPATPRASLQPKPARPSARPPTIKGFVRISPGTFTMGSPPSEKERDTDEVLRKVTITGAFELQSTEVTQGQWRALMDTQPSHFSSCGDDCPVEMVSWWDAAAYLNALSRKASLAPCYELHGCTGKPGDGAYECQSVTIRSTKKNPIKCKGYRFPTEAEWEYAARAGTTGSRYGALKRVAWYEGNSKSKSHPVATKQSNAWGLYDMLGNVWEWTGDWYDDYDPNDQRDPFGPEEGSSRVNRGGGWNYPAPLRFVRAAYRSGFSPGWRSQGRGVRPARSLR